MTDPGCTLCNRTDEHTHRGDGWGARYVRVTDRPTLVLDEVTATSAHAHLERMSESGWTLILDLPNGTQIIVDLDAPHGRAHVDALIVGVSGG